MPLHLLGDNAPSNTMKLLQKVSYLIVIGFELLQQNNFSEQVVQKKKNNVEAFDGAFMRIPYCFQALEIEPYASCPYSIWELLVL